MSTSRTVVQRILGAASACALLMGFGAVTQEAAAGISNTRHNLSSGPNAIAGRNQSTTITDLCVFCHTPHSGDSSTIPTGAIRPPLWNKTLPASTGFTTYPTTGGTIEGQILPDVGSISVACLSCHDGSQAMDNIVNMPGSGGRLQDGGGVGGRSGTWTGAGVDTATGTLLAANPANLGKDLRDDHPIGIQYCGGFGTNGLSPTGACRDPDFFPATQVGVNWYVDSPGNKGGAAPGVRDKTDMWLYNRSFTGIGVVTPSVECGSCHDPHTEAATQGQVSFLRVSNAGSNLCLVCHNK